MNSRTLTATLLTAVLSASISPIRAAPPEGGMGTISVQTDPHGPGFFAAYGNDVMFGPGLRGMIGAPMCGPMLTQPLIGGPLFDAVAVAGPGMLGRAHMDTARMLSLPDLTEAQRRSLTERQRDLQRQLLKLQEKALDAQFALEDVASKERPDPKAVGGAMQDVFAVRRQMVEATIAAHNDLFSILTEEQVQALSGRGPATVTHSRATLTQ